MHMQMLCINIRYRQMYVRQIIICVRYKAEYFAPVKCSIFTSATFSVVPSHRQRRKRSEKKVKTVFGISSYCKEYLKKNDTIEFQNIFIISSEGSIRAAQKKKKKSVLNVFYKCFNVSPQHPVCVLVSATTSSRALTQHPNNSVLEKQNN